MERKCLRCAKLVPRFFVIDGRRHNCQRRKYCFDCSPYGEHNTRQLEFGLNKLPCIDCGRSHKQKGRRCPTCNHRNREVRCRDRIQSIVGTKCWVCGYDKVWRNLHFHHVNPERKLFNITSREAMLKWDRIFAELQKCALVCGNCHGEIHENVCDKDIVSMHQEFWTNYARQQS